MMEYDSRCNENPLDYQPFDAKLEFDPSRLRILDVLLAEGHFGDVYLGILNVKGSRLPVAVKTPKSVSRERMRLLRDTKLFVKLKLQRESLRNDLRMLSQIGAHSNILRLLGAITTSHSDFLVVTEYCENGNLYTFLREKYDSGYYIDELIGTEDEDNYFKPVDQRSLNEQRSRNKFLRTMRRLFWQTPVNRKASYEAQFNVRRNAGQVTTSDLMWFGFQIARAMNFLAENRILHRDVALRNVLIKADYSIRLADFGLSRRLDKNGFYYDKDVIDIPYRYVAPEALKSGRSTIESEYWSYGIFLWELFTLGRKLPYADECGESQKLNGLQRFLEDGKRLEIPDSTTSCFDSNDATMERRCIIATVIYGLPRSSLK